jgi:hypothetical protein
MEWQKDIDEGGYYVEVSEIETGIGKMVDGYVVLALNGLVYALDAIEDGAVHTSDYDTLDGADLESLRYAFLGPKIPGFPHRDEIKIIDDMETSEEPDLSKINIGDIIRKNREDAVKSEPDKINKLTKLLAEKIGAKYDDDRLDEDAVRNIPVRDGESEASDGPESATNDGTYESSPDARPDYTCGCSDCSHRTSERDY